MVGARRWRSAILFITVLLADALQTRSSGAEADAEPIRFEYTADAGCPSRDEVLHRIRSYTTRWTIGEGEGTRRFLVRIERRRAAFAGWLEVRSPRHDAVRRAIEGDECSDVATGIAIAVALAIDPGASLVRREENAEEPTELAPEPRESTPEPLEPSSAPSKPAPDASPRAESRTRQSAPPRPPAATVTVALGVRGGANEAVSGVLAHAGIFGEVAWRPPFEHIRWFAPAVRLGMEHGFTRTVEVGAYDVDLDWTAGFIEVCPAHAGFFDDRLRLSACLAAHAGVLSANVVNALRGGETDRFWFDYGVLATARWMLSSSFFVEVIAGGLVPLRRDRIRIEPYELVSVAPPVGWTTSVGAGWRL